MNTPDTFEAHHLDYRLSGFRLGDDWIAAALRDGRVRKVEHGNSRDDVTKRLRDWIDRRGGNNG